MCKRCLLGRTCPLLARKQKSLAREQSDVARKEKSLARNEPALARKQDSRVRKSPAPVRKPLPLAATARPRLNSRKLPSMLAPCPVSAHPPAVPAGSTSTWHARLELGFAADGARTALVHRLHQGPLRVQKALYPEGPEVCHALVLHPPAGIAGRRACGS